MEFLEERGVEVTAPMLRKLNIRLPATPTPEAEAAAEAGDGGAAASSSGGSAREGGAGGEEQATAAGSFSGGLDMLEPLPLGAQLAAVQLGPEEVLRVCGEDLKDFYHYIRAPRKRAAERFARPGPFSRRSDSTLTEDLNY